MENDSNNSGLPGATPEVSETSGETPITKADLEKYFADYRQKTNAELASLRRHIKGGAEVQTSNPTPSTPVSQEDLRLSREIGKLEAELGDSIVSALGEDYETASVQEQARMLRLAKSLSSLHKPEVQTTSQRSETLNPRIPAARGQAPLPRDVTPRPRTKTEFADLRKRDPQAANDLLRDASFDLGSLPFK